MENRTNPFSMNTNTYYDVNMFVELANIESYHDRPILELETVKTIAVFVIAHFLLIQVIFESAYERGSTMKEKVMKLKENLDKLIEVKTTAFLNDLIKIKEDKDIPAVKNLLRNLQLIY